MRLFQEAVGMRLYTLMNISLKTINGESDALWPLSLLVWGGCMVPNVCHANTKKNNNPRFCELQKKTCCYCYDADEQPQSSLT